MKKETTKTPESILYILMRNDLPSMSTGKAMAQASHASNAFIKHHGNLPDVKAWAAQTGDGFGTVIVLSASWLQIDTAFKALDDPMLFDHGQIQYGKVIDPSYPYIVNSEIAELIDKKCHTVVPIPKSDGNVVLHRKELTCAYVFGTKEELKNVIGHLPLHP